MRHGPRILARPAGPWPGLLTAFCAIFGALFWTVLWTGPLAAGPWPREPGHGFFALSQEEDTDGASWSGLYGEFGLSPRLTLGLDAGRSGNGDGTALLFLQRALGRLDGVNHFAGALGIGVARSGGQENPVAQAMLGWGRGFAALPLGESLGQRLGPGWVAVELKHRVSAKAVRTVYAPDTSTEVTYNYVVPEQSTKAEITLGLRPSPRLTLINQLQLDEEADAPFSARLSTGIVTPLGAPEGLGRHLKLEAALVTPLAGRGEAALKLGTWLEF